VRQRMTLWVVLAGLLAGAAGVIATVADDDGKPDRLPALAAAGGGTGRDAAATMSADSGGAGVAESSMPAPGGVEYEVEGDLPELDGEGPAYELGGTVTGDDVLALARQLGIAGSVIEGPTGWVVASEASPQQLVVNKVSGHPWFSGEMAGCGMPAVEPSPEGEYRSLDIPRCADEKAILEEREREAVANDAAASASAGGAAGSEGGVTASDTPTSSSDAAIRCEAPPCPPDAVCTAPACPDEPYVEPERPADMPSKTEAEGIARGLFTRLGVELEGATVRVEDGFSQWYVTVEPAIDGLPTTGFTWQAGIGPKGAIAHAGGWLDDPEHTDDYPLAGTDAALERLRTGGGWYGGAMPMAATRDAAEPAIAIDCPPEADCAPAEPVVVKITGVKLGLQFSPVFDERGNQTGALLIPTYLFETSTDAYPLPVIAVADEYLPEPPAPVQIDPMPVDLPADDPATDPVADADPDAGGGSSPGSPGAGG
jgi:hypothetical protein